jgi:hypothetical protein
MRKIFFAQAKKINGVSEKELIKIAVKSLGLDELAPFNPDEKIIEYLLRDNDKSKLVNMKMTAFANETASESPAPAAAQFRLMWAHWAFRWALWWPIFLHTKRDGMNDGKNLAIGPKKDRLSKMNY